MILCTSSVYSQKIHIGKKVIDILGNTAKAYLLSANRPSIGISADLSPKKKVSIDIGTVYSNDFIEVPAEIEYGISNRMSMLAGIPFYTQTYRFNGNKVGGVGDAHLGLKFKLHESEYFIHSFQVAVKIPTASSANELGTGKLDYHFGIAEGFYTGRFSYELTAELNLLKRRDFPNTRQINIRLLQSAIDSLKKYYDYKFEPEMAFSFSPAVDLSRRFSVYAGTAFVRNFKLDYNTMELFAGFGYMPGKNVSLSIGSSFGIINSANWLASAGISLIL